MSTIVVWLKKTWLAACILALGFASLPMVGAHALTVSDPRTTPTPTQKGTNRLEQVWVREQAIYGKLSTFFTDIDQRITRWQQLINKAKANGKDITTLQTALDNFSGAVKQAEPIYQSTIGTVSSHPGFDENGNVTDQAQALTTVKDLGEKFREIRQLILGSANALRDAMKAFRSANLPAATPAPNQSGG
jgi:hypothetical protein